MDDMEQICKRLKEFPNSFQLTLNYLCDSKKVKKACQTVETEKREDPADFNEIRDDNLLSYLHWELAQEVGIAEKLNKTVLNKDPNNLIALGNYAMLCTKKDNLIEAKQILEKLNALKCSMEYDNLLTNAKAELAYSYARFGLGSGMDGLRYDDHAIELYKEVLQKQPKNWVWTFGYGLTLQRSLNVNFYHTVKKFDASAVFKQAFDALFGVASECENNSLRGKAWCKLALAINQYDMIPDRYKRRGETHIPSRHGLTRKQCIINAEKAARNDCTVLQECGKYYRSKHNLDLGKARSCLEAALHIKETTFTHVQLGLLEVDELNWSRKHSQLSVGKGYGHGGGIQKPTQRNISDSGMYSHHQYKAKDQQPSDSEFYGMSSAAKPNLSTDQVASHAYNVSLTPSPITTKPIFLIPQVSELPTNMVSLSLQTSLPRPKVSTTITFKQPVSSPTHQTNKFVDGYHNLLSKFLKSPSKLPTDPNNPKLLKALQHFKRAAKLSCSDCDAAYEQMGIVYRRLSDVPNAITCFEQYAKGNSLSKIISYEQRGMCYLELAAMANGEEEKQKYIHTASHMFLKAIEAQATMITFPINVVTQSLPSLQQLLLTERGKNPRDTTSLKTLSHLKRLIGNYGEALAFLDDVLSIDPEDTEAQLQKAETLISSEKYEEAVTYLRLLLCTNVRSNVKLETLLSACLAAAEKRLLHNHINTAKDYFQMAYNIAFQLDPEEDSTEYPVSIIACSDSETETQIAFFIDIIHKYFGLHTFHPHKIGTNKLELTSKGTAFQCSRNILVIANDINDGDLLYDIELAVSSKRPSGSYTFSIIGNSNCIVPACIPSTKYTLVTEYTAWPQEENTPAFIEDVMKLFRALIKHI